MMNIKDALNKTMEEYRQITGLRSYLILDTAEIQSASERNYFCKCLKSSSTALKKCEECTQETYNNARSIDKECIYSCHAGLIKWAVPITCEDFHCVIVSEGILAEKQKEEADYWAEYLSKEYDLSREMIRKNLEVVTTMNEEQVYASIKLLKDLISYNLEVYKANK